MATCNFGNIWGNFKIIPKTYESWLFSMSFRNVYKPYSLKENNVSALSANFQENLKKPRSSSSPLPIYSVHSQHTPHAHIHRQTPTFPHMVKECVLHSAGSYEQVPEKCGIMKVIFKRITLAALCRLA